MNYGLEYYGLEFYPLLQNGLQIKFEKKAALMAYIKLGQKIDNIKFFSFNS